VLYAPLFHVFEALMTTTEPQWNSSAPAAVAMDQLEMLWLWMPMLIFAVLLLVVFIIYQRLGRYEGRYTY